MNVDPEGRGDLSLSELEGDHELCSMIQARVCRVYHRVEERSPDLHAPGYHGSIAYQELIAELTEGFGQHGVERCDDQNLVTFLTSHDRYSSPLRFVVWRGSHVADGIEMNRRGPVSARLVGANARLAGQYALWPELMPDPDVYITVPLIHSCIDGWLQLQAVLPTDIEHNKWGSRLVGVLDRVVIYNDKLPVPTMPTTVEEPATEHEFRPEPVDIKMDVELVDEDDIDEYESGAS